MGRLVSALQFGEGEPTSNDLNAEIAGTQSWVRRKAL
jgi:hypothetical protein